MKKIITIFVATVLSIAVVSTIDARVRTSRATTTTNKRVVNKKMIQGTKQLETQLDNVNKATTPEAKKLAQQEADEAAKQLQEDLKADRSLTSDLTWYEAKQKEVAKAKLARLDPLEKKLNAEIKKIEDALDPITKKGWIWNAAIPGNEEKYNSLTQDLAKKKEMLKKVQRGIREQSIITGTAWANAYRALLAAGAVGTAGAVYYGTPVVLAAGKATASWVGEKGLSAWDYTKIAAKYGAGAASTFFAYKKMYDNARTAYSLAQLAYKKVAGNPQASEQDKAAAAKEVDNAKVEMEKHNNKLTDFQQKLSTMSKEQLDALAKQIKKQ